MDPLSIWHTVFRYRKKRKEKGEIPESCKTKRITNEEDLTTLAQEPRQHLIGYLDFPRMKEKDATKVEPNNTQMNKGMWNPQREETPHLCRHPSAPEPKQTWVRRKLSCASNRIRYSPGAGVSLRSHLLPEVQNQRTELASARNEKSWLNSGKKVKEKK